MKYFSFHFGKTLFAEFSPYFKISKMTTSLLCSLSDWNLTFPLGCVPMAWVGAEYSAFSNLPSSNFRKCRRSKFVKLVNGCAKSLNSCKMFKDHFPMLIWPLKKHLISMFKKLPTAWFTWISVWEEDQRKSFCVWKRKKRELILQCGNGSLWKVSLTCLCLRLIIYS